MNVFIAYRYALRYTKGGNIEFLTAGDFLFEFDIDHILICIL